MDSSVIYSNDKSQACFAFHQREAHLIKQRHFCWGFVSLWGMAQKCISMARSEESASNNLENRVISTSSCNTMTPIHQSHLLLDAVWSDLPFPSRQFLCRYLCFCFLRLLIAGWVVIIWLHHLACYKLLRTGCFRLAGRDAPEVTHLRLCMW